MEVVGSLIGWKFHSPKISVVVISASESAAVEADGVVDWQNFETVTCRQTVAGTGVFGQAGVGNRT